MKHLKVAEARMRFGEILDQAEQGSPVLIERKGVVFRLTADTASPKVATRKNALFEFVDDAVLSGNWGWKPGKKGLVFTPRRKAR